MMNKSLALLVSAALMLSTACGGSDQPATPVLNSIAITLPSAILLIGTTEQAQAIGYYSDNSSRSLAGEATWTSSNPAIATVSGGLIVALATGTTELTASSEGIVGQATLRVTKEEQRYHRAFVSSVTGNGNLSTWNYADGNTGLAAADAVCQALAANAGLEGTFRAWMSDDANDAYCRLQGFSGKKAQKCNQAVLPVNAGPWMRIDGFPLAGQIDTLIKNQFLAPIRFDEVNRPVQALLFTGTDFEGKLSAAAPCANWTSTNAPEVNGWNSSRTSWSDLAKCNENHSLLCMETGKGQSLPSFAQEGKKVFVTSVMGSGKLETWADANNKIGLEAGDAICQALAQAVGLANAQSFKAWLSTSNANAKDRLTSNGPWVRLDGVEVASNNNELVDGELFTSIGMTETRTYLLGSLPVWTGTSVNGKGTFTNGSPVPSCQGWTSNSGTDHGEIGLSNCTDYWWTALLPSKASGTDTGSCDSLARLYCFEDS